MSDELSKIHFIAANYSRLQGLRVIPLGLLAIFVSVWAIYNHGPSANLTQPILAAAGAMLLYWLTGRYYNQTFGQVKQRRQISKETIFSLISGGLALLAFWLDTTGIIPISTLGLVFASSFFEYFLRTDRSDWKKIWTFFPENVIAAVLLIGLSILPLFGLDWWLAFGIKSQIVSMFIVFGIVIIVTGIWGHIRLIRTLRLAEGKQDDHAL